MNNLNNPNNPRWDNIAKDAADLAHLGKLVSPNMSWIVNKFSQGKYLIALSGIGRNISAFVHKIGYFFTHGKTAGSDTTILNAIKDKTNLLKVALIPIYHKIKFEPKQGKLLDQAIIEARHALDYIDSVSPLLKEDIKLLDQMKVVDRITPVAQTVFKSDFEFNTLGNFAEHYYEKLMNATFNEDKATPVEEWMYDFLYSAEDGSKEDFEEFAKTFHEEKLDPLFQTKELLGNRLILLRNARSLLNHMKFQLPSQDLPKKDFAETISEIDFKLELIDSLSAKLYNNWKGGFDPFTVEIPKCFNVDIEPSSPNSLKGKILSKDEEHKNRVKTAKWYEYAAPIVGILGLGALATFGINFLTKVNPIQQPPQLPSEPSNPQPTSNSPSNQQCPVNINPSISEPLKGLNSPTISPFTLQTNAGNQTCSLPTQPKANEFVKTPINNCTTSPLVNRATHFTHNSSQQFQPVCQANSAPVSNPVSQNNSSLLQKPLVSDLQLPTQSLNNLSTNVNHSNGTINLPVSPINLSTNALTTPKDHPLSLSSPNVVNHPAETFSFGPQSAPFQESPVLKSHLAPNMPLIGASILGVIGMVAEFVSSPFKQQDAKNIVEKPKNDSKSSIPKKGKNETLANVNAKSKESTKHNYDHSGVKIYTPQNSNKKTGREFFFPSLDSKRSNLDDDSDKCEIIVVLDESTIDQSTVETDVPQTMNNDTGPENAFLLLDTKISNSEDDKNKNEKNADSENFIKLESNQSTEKHEVVQTSGIQINDEKLEENENRKNELEKLLIDVTNSKNTLVKCLEDVKKTAPSLKNITTHINNDASNIIIETAQNTDKISISTFQDKVVESKDREVKKQLKIPKDKFVDINKIKIKRQISTPKDAELKAKAKLKEEIDLQNKLKLKADEERKKEADALKAKEDRENLELKILNDKKTPNPINEKVIFNREEYLNTIHNEDKTSNQTDKNKLSEISEQLKKITTFCSQQKNQDFDTITAQAKANYILELNPGQLKQDDASKLLEYSSQAINFKDGEAEFENLKNKIYQLALDTSQRHYKEGELEQSVQNLKQAVQTEFLNESKLNLSLDISRKEINLEKELESLHSEKFKKALEDIKAGYEATIQPDKNKGACGSLILKDTHEQPVGIFKLLTPESLSYIRRFEIDLKWLFGIKRPTECLPGAMAEAKGYAEKLAYDLDKELGFGLVPETNFIFHEGKLGCLQLFVEGYEEAGAAQNKEFYVTEKIPNEDELDLMQKFIIEDFLMGNLDRKPDNWMVKLDANGRLTNIAVIDNGNSFIVQNPAKEDTYILANQYKWSEHPYSKYAFTVKSIQLVALLDQSKIKEFFNKKKTELAAFPEAGKFFDDEMVKRTMERIDVLKKVVKGSKEDPQKTDKKPLDLAKIKTDNDFSGLNLK